MKFDCLASSSSGNCFIFQLDESRTSLMVECGISFGEIYKYCNQQKIDFSDVKACLITHAHGDHCKSAKEVSRLNIPIFTSKPTLDALNVKGNAMILNEPNRVLDGLFVIPFAVQHDIDGAVGFLIKTKSETILFINDSKGWDINLINFKPDYVFIECNYDQTMVYAQLNTLKHNVENEIFTGQVNKEDHMKIKQHERNLKSHMSLAGCIRNLKRLNLSKCKAIFLMHLSDRYANEYKMKLAIQNEFGIRTLACQKKGGIK
ncbi:MAG: MBL fold metallo-hydrolase [Acholeplasmataceae bacterium]|jgi:Cft2 family RNA processing exonuclease